MRARLLLVFAILAIFATTVFAVPLLVERSQSRTQELLLERSADLRRFADLADDYAGTIRERSLRGELEAYTDLYGEPVLVILENGGRELNTGIDTGREDVAQVIANTIRNQPVPAVKALSPFSPGTLLLAQPIGADSQVSGAVLIEVSTADAIAGITRAWVLVALSALAGLLVFGAIAQLLSRWVLRPLSTMNRRIRQMRDSLPFIRDAHSEDTEHERAYGPPELQTVSRTLDSMKSALAASIDAQRRLVADTAHQLRNPMAALQLRLDAIQATQTPEQSEAVAHAIDESERLNAILDDLLSLARAESLTLSAQPCHSGDVLEVVRERVGNWRPLVEQQGGTITVNAGTGSLAARFQKHLLQQYLDVLLDNAAKYAPGTAIDISVRASSPEEVQLVVEDHGPGVSEERLGKLTQRFYRAGPSADRSGTQAGGSGLGLSIAKAIAQAMDGTLTLAHGEPHGLRATLQLSRGHAGKEMP